MNRAEETLAEISKAAVPSPRKISEVVSKNPASSEKPSSFYRGNFWQLGLSAARNLSPNFCAGLSRGVMKVYCSLASQRREIVVQNLLPALNNDRALAKNVSAELFQNFAQKLVDLWRYESGVPIENLFHGWNGWEYFEAAQKEKRGVLIVTPHLGNWEFGAPLLAGKGIKLLVITLEEPDSRLTEMRKASRAHWGIETLVLGRDTFAFVEIIRRLEAGAIVALLVDRPPATSSVEVELFGRPFAASIAAAELARATGCVLLPVYLPRNEKGYFAHSLPPISYDRAGLRQFEARRDLTQKIISVFEPVIRENISQWYHFVPVWKK